MTVNFNKYQNNLVPAIIQDSNTKTVLMLGYMNQEALQKTQTSKHVTFFSRSKNRLWTKGESSGNYLELVDIKVDCDQDALLISAKPVGPTCHTGSDTCWDEKNESSFGFLTELETIITQRKNDASDSDSYVASLFKEGMNKIAQKVGEEAIEVVIEAKDENDTLFLNESADLLFHYLILLQAKGFTLKDVESILISRNS
ncbi:bifunctional phosphoribosyl-AMP cyclohydrolase/phosphoribosyl-ATP diphosphatase HisIE [Bizionia argentinensis JUB59]|uniref:Histidine biosynthesis bifunctional protein HisIE n=1 Tax=Bizionia argentinensis JUB59 TaxID=1046627 RepID=G2E9E4_9FLAO|nr:bifunctional phosphoribosyl-AMP cyclohydrolase/phosphoribosyl-ATP diphosphatase HisIE [Bizionia argentinensis]EGV44998.1 bifunctional phosphoribosyl-AMP cyclohydrolase/phosphoribosyl-ATP diphosphatase HisIE [Bizionia argentinensis JUB59]